MRIPFLGGIGVPELIIILIVVLLIFGPKNLPKLGNAIGRTFKSLRDGMEGKKKKKEDADEEPAKVEVDASTESVPQADAKPVEEAVVEETAAQTEKAPASKTE